MASKQIQSIYEDAKSRWESSQDCIDLKQLITSMDDSTKVRITNIVCLEIGSLNDSDLNYRHRSHTQLAALNTIKEVLGSGKIKCIAQDRAFDKIDKEFLRPHGYEIVDDPARFAAIDSGSLVFMINGTGRMVDKISRGTWPAALVTSKIVSRQEQRGKMEMHGVHKVAIDQICPLDGEDQRMNMVSGCQEEAFPNELKDRNEILNIADCSWFGISIYWRRKQ